MGVLFLAVAVIIINLGLWAIFLAKFRKLFSTDDLITSARTEMNHMIADMQRNTSLSVDLIENRIKELKAISAEADRHLAILQKELEKAQQSKIFQNHLQTLQTSSERNPAERRGSHQNNYAASYTNNPRSNPAQRAAQNYMKSAQSSQISSDQSYSPTKQGMEAVAAQGDLFADTVDIPKPQVFTVKSDGAAYTSVPLVTPEVTFVENPVTSKKDFTSQVRDLAKIGQSVEEIASTLGRSIQEVQFALDMGF